MRMSSDKKIVTLNDDFRRELIFSISDIFEDHGVAIYDENCLRSNKELILFAFLFEICTNRSKEEAEIYSASALLLANFQPGVGPEPIFPVNLADSFKKSQLLQQQDVDINKLLELRDNNFFKFSIIASKERLEISKRIRNAKSLNLKIKPWNMRLLIMMYDKIYPIYRNFLIAVILAVYVPALMLPSELRKKVLGGRPSDWINSLRELPDRKRSIQWPDVGNLL